MSHSLSLAHLFFFFIFFFSSITCFSTFPSQMLYHVNAFRRAVYKLPHDNEVIPSHLPCIIWREIPSFPSSMHSMERNTFLSCIVWRELSCIVWREIPSYLALYGEKYLLCTIFLLTLNINLSLLQMLLIIYHSPSSDFLYFFLHIFVHLQSLYNLCRNFFRSYLTIWSYSLDLLQLYPMLPKSHVQLLLFSTV